MCVRVFRLALHCTAAIALCAFVGCQFPDPGYPVEANGLVRNGETGSPLDGARIKIVTGEEESRRRSFVLTGSDGRFTYGISVSDTIWKGDTLPQWTVSISKAGFETKEVVNERQEKTLIGVRKDIHHVPDGIPHANRERVADATCHID
jgi:hypothetical protein